MAALAADPVGARRGVFDNSLALGRAFSRFFSVEIPLGELPELLGRLAVPCLAGSWRTCPDEPGLLLERDGCPAGRQGPTACDWWRDAIDGLVLGITGGLLHARHESVGHGGARCVDVVYVRPEGALRFGPIPAELHPVLERVCRMARAFDSTADIEFLGVSEGTLFYLAKRSGCGGELSVTSLVEREVGRRMPSLSVREISPRSIAL